MLSKIYKHKFISIIFFAAIAGCAFFAYKKFVKKEDLTKYVLAAVEKGSITVSVSASGQVAASSQIDIKSKISGDIASVNAAKGQKVKEGDLLLQIDSYSAQKTVRDARLALDIAKADLGELLKSADALEILQAENSVQTAKNNLEKLLAPIDEFDLLQAQKAVDDAKNSIENLKYSYEKEHKNIIDEKNELEKNIEKSYGDAYNSIANIFLELPEIISKARDALYSYDIAKSDSLVPLYADNNTVLINSVFGDDRYELAKFIDRAKNDFDESRKKFDENFSNYKETGYNSENEIIRALLDETLKTAEAASIAIKSEMNMFDFWIDRRSEDEQKIFSKVSEYKTELGADTSKTGGYLSNLLSIKNSLENSEKNTIKAERNLLDMERSYSLETEKAEWAVKEKEENLKKIIQPAEAGDIASAKIALKEKESVLEKLKAGADSIDIEAKENYVQQKADILADARKALDNCSVRALFSGTIAELNVNKGDSVSSGGILAILISDQKIAEISLNEIDAAKVKLGQKAIISFDAIEGLSITGKTVEIDETGTVSQGVASFSVKISFDMEDERIKPGMSLSASIITDIKQDILMAPNAAVKSLSESYYIEIPSEEISSALPASLSGGIALKKTPGRQIVEIGIANDSYTEISSGLKEGDKIIVRSVSTSAASQSSQSQQKNILQMGGSGAMRMMR